MSIVEFLEARIAEDEAAARAVVATVAPDPWENPTKWGNFFPADIAFYDVQTPARVLAECAAKGAIIGRHAVCDDVSYGDASTCPEMTTLAAVYSDHSDYDKDWAL